MNENEINYFLDGVTVKQELIESIEGLREEMRKAMAPMMEPVYKVNRWGETPVEYQKWINHQITSVLQAANLSHGTRNVIAYMFSKIDHPFNQDVKLYVADDCDFMYDKTYNYTEFKQAYIATNLGMTNKGVREILENLSELDQIVQRHPHKPFHWIFNGEAVARGYDK